MCRGRDGLGAHGAGQLTRYLGVQVFHRSTNVLSRFTIFGGLFVIAGIGFVTVVQRNQSWTARIEDPSPVGQRVDDLVGKLDPNSSEAQALVAIPGLGERRSRDIVAFREKKNLDGNAIVYHEIKDLMQVRGIGPALSKQMEPYLDFPTTAPTTMPSD